jgi:hypothetical protein
MYFVEIRMFKVSVMKFKNGLILINLKNIVLLMMKTICLVIKTL